MKLLNLKTMQKTLMYIIISQVCHWHSLAAHAMISEAPENFWEETKQYLAEKDPNIGYVIDSTYSLMLSKNNLFLGGKFVGPELIILGRNLGIVNDTGEIVGTSFYGELVFDLLVAGIISHYHTIDKDKKAWMYANTRQLRSLIRHQYDKYDERSRLFDISEKYEILLLEAYDRWDRGERIWDKIKILQIEDLKIKDLKEQAEL